VSQPSPAVTGAKPWTTSEAERNSRSRSMVALQRPSGRGSAWRGVVSVALRGVGNLSNLPRWPRGAQPLAITGNLTRLIARDCSAIKRAISARASGGELRLTCAVSRGKRAARGQGESVSGVVRREARRAAGGHKLEDNLRPSKHRSRTRDVAKRKMKTAQRPCQCAPVSVCACGRQDQASGWRRRASLGA